MHFRRSNKNQSTMSAHEKKEMKLAVMLMIVVVVFLICNILALIVNILEAMKRQVSHVTEISNLLVTINSSVNFFIYIIFGEKFKRQFWQCLRQKSCCLRYYFHENIVYFVVSTKRERAQFFHFRFLSRLCPRPQAPSHELVPLHSTLPVAAMGGSPLISRSASQNPPEAVIIVSKPNTVYSETLVVVSREQRK